MKIFDRVRNAVKLLKYYRHVRKAKRNLRRFEQLISKVENVVDFSDM